MAPMPSARKALAWSSENPCSAINSRHTRKNRCTSAPTTDGAAGVWVLSEQGRKRLPEGIPTVKLVDYELAAVDFQVDGWEIHEAFAGQVLANVAALETPGWVAERTGIRREFGRFPWERVNPNGGSVAIGHPFGATGARDPSQAIKELAALPKGSRAIVSICADGGEGAVALLES